MEGVEIEDLLDYTFISNVEISPNGQAVGFIVHEVDSDENDYDSNIWLHRFDSDETFQLTTGGKDKKFIWLNDDRILFVSGRNEEDEEDEEEEESEEKTDLFVIDIDGGEARHFDTIEKEVIDLQLEEENDLLIFQVKEKVEEERDEDEGSEDDIEEGEDYHELDEIPFWSNEGGFKNKERAHLYSYSLEEKEMEPLITGYKQVRSFDLNEKRISLSMTEYEDKMDFISYLYEYDHSTDELTKLTDKELNIAKVRLLEDKIIFEATDMEDMGMNTNKEFYVYDLEEHVYYKETDMDKSLGNTVLTDVRYGIGEVSRVENERYYFISTEGHQSKLYSFSLEGGVEKVIDDFGTVDHFDVKDDKIVFTGLKDQVPQELYFFEENDSEEKNIVKLTDFNEIEKEVSEPERFTVESNGKEIECWIMKPVDHEPGESYPTVVEIHGGPKTVFGEVFFHELQVLASNGYAVVYSNPLGSSGSGNSFADIIGKYGTEDQEDIMKVVDTAIEKYDFIDEDKLGVTGGSYGGFMTNWLVGHLDRFKAGVSCRSISNWTSMFSTTDIGYYFVEDQFDTTPWEDQEFLWERSPLKYADKVDTPLLLIQSRTDFRCYEAEAIQMFTALKYHGADSKLVLFEEENHDLSRSGRPKQRIKRLEEIVGWFDKYLKETE
ncbi:MAG: S9 family peptidase [Candidatus Thermoplasmatota archaeon]|nr:S9 family peptidase [Candidatus Thermoplasmatota archaeon]